MNSQRSGSMQHYDPEQPYATPFGHWRYMIAPTGICESGGQMACINTYDRAYFTFGFCQFAAHVSDGDFVRYFRHLLRNLPNASHYFPDLALNDRGHLSRRIGADLRDLEIEEQEGVTGLMRYLNPPDTEVEEAEVLNAARLIHWCETDTDMRNVMVAEAVDAAKNELTQQNRARPFANTKHANPLDALCVAVIDIIHHEGSQYEKIDGILKSESEEEKALVALCNAGVEAGRNKKLLNAIAALRSKGALGQIRFAELPT